MQGELRASGINLGEDLPLTDQLLYDQSFTLYSSIAARSGTSGSLQLADSRL